VAPSREEHMIAINDLMREVFGRHLRPRHKPHDLELTLGQMHCLHTVERMGSPSMSELSAELLLQPSTVTGLVDVLVQQGLIERSEDPQDRRVVRVQLSVRARRQKEQRHRAMRNRMMALLGDLSDDELVRIHEALGLLHAAAARRAALQESEGNGDNGPAEGRD